VAGDLTMGGSLSHLQNLMTWLDTQPHAHKITIAGNHDVCLDPSTYLRLAHPSSPPIPPALTIQ
jgi:hypothetical protein